jgi:hypothetical protein
MNDEQLLDAFAELMEESFPEDDAEIEMLLAQAGLDGPGIEKEAAAIIEELKAQYVVRKRARRTRVIWAIKQCLPLSYKSTFVENDQRVRCTWRMWLGRCFNINSFVLADE